MRMFNTKFFCDEVTFILAELGRTTQHLDEDLDLYVKRFRERALDFSDVVD